MNEIGIPTVLQSSVVQIYWKLANIPYWIRQVRCYDSTCSTDTEGRYQTSMTSSSSWGILVLPVIKIPVIRQCMCQLYVLRSEMLQQTQTITLICAYTWTHFVYDHIYMWHDQGEWVGCREYWFWVTGLKRWQIPMFFIVFKFQRMFLSLQPDVRFR